MKKTQKAEKKKRNRGKKNKIKNGEDEIKNTGRSRITDFVRPLLLTNIVEVKHFIMFLIYTFLGNRYLYIPNQEVPAIIHK